MISNLLFFVVLLKYINWVQNKINQHMRGEKQLINEQSNLHESTYLRDKEQNEARIKFKSHDSFEIHSVTSEFKNSPASTSELNDQFNYRYGRQLKKLVDSFEDQGEVIRLAYLSNNQEVHIDEETLYFLQKYSTFQLAFITFIGSAQSRFIADTILNVSCAEGNKFTIADDGREKGIYMWSIPFAPNSKKKIFVLESSQISFENGELNRQDQILLDLVNIISSIVVVHPLENKQKKRNPIFRDSSPLLQQDNIGEELRKSRERIIRQNSNTDKIDSYWPQLLSFLHYSKIPITANSLYLQNYSTFNSTSLPQPFSHEADRSEEIHSLNNKMKGINPLFINTAAAMFAELINKTLTKQYENLKFTGNICCKLLINSIKYLNKKPKIKMDKIFISILKELYQSSYEYHVELYNDYLKQYFADEQPLSHDSLLDSFQASSAYTIQSFNQIVMESCMHEQYQLKVLQYIENKEEMLLQINSKKTSLALKNKIKGLENIKINDIDSMKMFMKNLNSIQNCLDHNKCPVVTQRLIKHTKNIEKRILEEKEIFDRERIKYLLKQKQYKALQLKEIKDQNEKRRRQNEQNDEKYKKLLKAQANADKVERGIKKQIEVEKKYQKEYIVSKQSKKEFAESLLQNLRLQEERLRDNKKQIEQIHKDYEYNPTILQLQKKIEDKQREIKQLQRLEQRISIISKNSVLNSALNIKSSLVRPAIQKPKDPQEPNQATGQTGQNVLNIQKKAIKKLSTKK